MTEITKGIAIGSALASLVFIIAIAMMEENDIARTLACHDARHVGDAGIWDGLECESHTGMALPEGGQ